MGQDNQKNDSQNSGQKAKNEKPATHLKSKETTTSKSGNTTKYLIIGLFAAVGLGYTITVLNKPATQLEEQIAAIDNLDAKNTEESGNAIETPEGAKYGFVSHHALKSVLPESLQTFDDEEETADNAYSVSVKQDSSEATDNSDMKQLTTVTDAQLNALNNQDVAKAYQTYTSKEFKQATSFDTFSQIVKDYPILTDRAKVNYDRESMIIDQNRATISATLQKGRDSIVIDYSLIKVGNEWKIWGVQFKDANPDTVADQEHSPEEKEVINVIDEQLNLFKRNDLSKAYKNYTSAEFQKITPFPTFQVFVSNYPILTKFDTITYGDVTFDNDKASVMADLEKGESSNPIEFTLTREGNQWKIYGLRLLVEDEGKVTSADIGEIQAVIKNQLSAIKSNNFDKAYSFNSKEFREATSSQSFQEYIKQYPFLQNSQVSYSNPVEMNQTMAVLVTFNGQGNSSDIEYRLVKEDGQWKIWSMNVVRNSANMAARPNSIKSEELQSTIQGQLAAARKGDSNKAYEQFTSKAFKESTSKSAFESFLGKNSVLSKNAGVVFGNLSFENDIGTYDATLTSADGETEPVKYRLVYEDNGWKILTINILYSQQPATKSLEITKVVLGTEIDLNGVVTAPLTTIKDPKDKITANVFIHNAVQGATVDLTLEHVKTASRINPVSTTLDQNGDSVVSFVFTPPTQGWPTGDYKLYVNSSTGAQTTVNFKVQ